MPVLLVRVEPETPKLVLPPPPPIPQPVAPLPVVVAVVPPPPPPVPPPELSEHDPHNSPWLPAIHVMPKTQEDLDNRNHLFTLAAITKPA